ncbi:VOC family protein [Mucilaginibacter sp. AW1-7]|jgi:PhnB protein|uniref:VOC family protein n=1 Tax=unclassified Mucilaginibacter TaxID=2617802 RepID=UPI00236732CB|nr:VOC family protein [Mucilaginibacter sp. KACC 22773]WDF78110.1 VOC family protein [Mucilaginibacter sp. KACC 22773]
MKDKPTFAPELAIPNGVKDISFYIEAFGAEELRRFSNDDGTIHVSELSINGAMFHLHEQTPHSGLHSLNGGRHSVVVGLFVEDVHAVIEQAVTAGAKITSPVQDYEYGYRQGSIEDPFGHRWQIQKSI